MEVDTSENIEIAPALTPDKISMDFHRGTVVWARCGPTFPFWPSCIIPNELLPIEIRQPLFSSPFDDVGEGFTSEALKRKISVYYYGRNDFDLIRPKEIKPFSINFDLYREQPISSDMITMFEMAIRQAQEALTLNVEDRLLLSQKLKSMNYAQWDSSTDNSPTSGNLETINSSELQALSVAMAYESAKSVFDQPSNVTNEAGSVFDQPTPVPADAGLVYDHQAQVFVEAVDVDFSGVVSQIVEKDCSDMMADVGSDDKGFATVEISVGQQVEANVTEKSNFNENNDVDLFVHITKQMSAQSSAAVESTIPGPKKIKSVKVLNIASSDASSLFGSSNSGGVDLFGAPVLLPSESNKSSLSSSGLPVPIAVRPKVTAKTVSASTSNKSESFASKFEGENGNSNLFSVAQNNEHNPFPATNVSSSSATLFSSAPVSVFEQPGDNIGTIVTHSTNNINGIQLPMATNKTAADVFATTPVPLVIPALGQKKPTVSAADFFTSAMPPQPAIPSVGPSGPPLPFAVPPSAPGVRPVSSVPIPLIRDSSSVIDSTNLQRELSSSKGSVTVNDKQEKTLLKINNGVRHGSSHMLQAATRLNQSNTQCKVIGPDAVVTPNTPSIDSPTTALITAASVPLAGRKIHKPVSAICSFGFGGVCILSFPPSNSVPPVIQSVGNRFDSPLHRLPLLGATPNLLLVCRQYNLWNKNIKQYGSDQHVKWEEETKRLLETLHAWRAGDLTPLQVAQHAEALKTAVQFVQKMISSPLRDITAVRTSSTSRQETCTDVLSEDGIYQNEKFLWRILEKLLYSLNSDHNQVNNSSMEKRLLALLTENDNAAVDLSQAGLPHGVPSLTTATFANGASSLNQTEYQRSVEQLIALGHREQAVDLAINQQDFALALLIAALCDPSVYQRVVRSLMERRFTQPASGVMQTFGFICCNQVQAAPILQSPSAKPTAFQIADKHVVSASSANSAIKELEQNWRMNAALLLSTKPQGWQSLLLRLAERLQSEIRDSVLTQSLLLITDALPYPLDSSGSQNMSTSDFQVFLKEQSLLHRSGCSLSLLADVQSVTALRASEIFESVLYFKFHGIVNQDSANTVSSSNKGNSGLFGWFGSNSSNIDNTNSKDKKKLLQQQKHVKQQTEERFASYKAFLLPLQLRLAMFLADCGLIPEAKSYTEYIQKNIKYLQQFHQSLMATLPPPTAEQANNNHVISNSRMKLSKKFIQAFEEFDERLSGHINVPNYNNNSPHGVISNGQEQNIKPSNWGTPFSFNVSLKDLVDGPQPALTATAAPVPSMSQQMPPAPAMSIASQQAVSTPFETNKPSIHEFQTQLEASPHVPFPAYQSYNNVQNLVSPPTAYNNSMGHVLFPSQQKIGIPTGTTSGPPLPGGRSPAFYGKTSASHMNIPNTAAVDTISNNYRFSVTNSTNKNNLTLMTETAKVESASSKMQPPQGPAPLTAPNVSQHQPQQAQSPQPPQTLAQPGNNDDLSAPTSGIMGTIRKGIIKWIMPNAVDATENTGSKLEAYFDKQLNRWVFPGEDPQDVAPLPPPPTSMVASTVSMNNSNASSLSGCTSSSAPPAISDPLAALMAPPSRSIPSATSFGSMVSLDDNSNDPLAMMMRPPPVRGIPSVGSMSSLRSSSPANTFAPPKISVWKPPTAAAIAIIPEPSSYVPGGPEPMILGQVTQSEIFGVPPEPNTLLSAYDNSAPQTDQYFSPPTPSSNNFSFHQIPPNDFDNNF